MLKRIDPFVVGRTMFIRIRMEFSRLCRRKFFISKFLIIFTFTFRAGSLYSLLASFVILSLVSEPCQLTLL